MWALTDPLPLGGRTTSFFFLERSLRHRVSKCTLNSQTVLNQLDGVGNQSKEKLFGSSRLKLLVIAINDVQYGRVLQIQIAADSQTLSEVYEFAEPGELREKKTGREFDS